MCIVRRWRGVEGSVVRKLFKRIVLGFLFELIWKVKLF